MAGYPSFKDKEEQERLSSKITKAFGSADKEWKIEEAGNLLMHLTDNLDFAYYVVCYFYD